MLIVDTNVLIRIVFNTGDNDEQHEKARKIILHEELVVPVIVFCEFTWVLRDCYKKSKSEIAKFIRVFLNTQVITDEEAVLAGLNFLENGGDFADGAIIHTGRGLAKSNKASFISFDRDAIRRAKNAGVNAINAIDF